MIKIYIKISLIGLLCFFITSCTEYQKLRKTSDWQPKYEAAMKYYEKKDFARAIAESRQTDLAQSRHLTRILGAMVAA